MKYVDVVIDSKSEYVDNLFTYGCTDDSVSVGQKVVVPFGKGNKLHDAYIFKVNEKPDKEIEGLKFIESLDSTISLTEEMLSTALFMKQRYFCKIIDGVKCFAPVGGAPKRRPQRHPLKDTTGEHQNIEQLTEEQILALNKIESAIRAEQNKLFLLHGITGSGKTEVYMRAIAQCLAVGKNAIILVPEISLTKQIIERFFARFQGENIAVMHSKLTKAERYDEWQRIRSGEVRIVIGVRSAVFAPMENIGVIIMDEEHDGSYKSDMTPRYDTVEIAIKRLKAHKGILISGSATPSVATYKRAEEGVYELISMKERYNKVLLPEVELVDMKKELLDGNRSPVSQALYKAMNNCLSKGQQVILFINRRGYSSFLSCKDCGYVFKCSECGISLAYHKRDNCLMCHYCGKKMRIPQVCPECKSKELKYSGSGTEKIEEFVEEHFSQYNTERLDSDAIRKKGSLERVLNSVKKQRTHILIGTQLVAKGLDFANVGLVGIVNADMGLNIPDYRAAERTFQLIAQAAGRSGRGDEQGKVIIQSFTPEHYAVQAAASHDFARFYAQEIVLRQILCYPPYCDMVYLTFTGTDEGLLTAKSSEAAKRLRRLVGNAERENIYDPQPSYLVKANGQYKYSIMIKCPKGSRAKYAGLLEGIKSEIAADKKKKYHVSVDFNPYSLV